MLGLKIRDLQTSSSNLMKRLTSPSGPVPRPLLMLVCFWFALCREAHSEWLWAHDEVVTSMAGGRLLAVFRFQNAGSGQVTVQELRFSCSCAKYSFKATAAEAEKDGTLQVFFPSDAMEETVEFVAFGSGGTTPKQLTVQIRKPAKTKP